MIEGIDLYTNYSGFAIASEVCRGGAKFKDKDFYKVNYVRARLWR
jgi:hypothetical protein